MRVLFTSTGLGTGGAEQQLLQLLHVLQGWRIRAGVVCLASRGAVSEKIEELGVHVWHLGLDQWWSLPLAPVRIAAIVRRFRPDVIQGWMYHGNLAAQLATSIMGGTTPSVWSVRQSLYDIGREKPMTRSIVRLSARLSRRPALIVYNATRARLQHEAFGFSSSRGRVIGNGFNGETWHPDPQARLSVRDQLGVAPETPLVGLIARYHPMKGHEVFFEAAHRLAAARSEVHFLLAGNGVEAGKPPFSQWLAESPALAERMHLLGERRDIPDLTAALDVASSSSSWGDAFSNTVAEALLCSVPVVATDVGDARAIVGDSGAIVPPGDAAELAAAWERLLVIGQEGRWAMGETGRSLLLERYGIEAVAGRYMELYQEVCKSCQKS